MLCPLFGAHSSQAYGQIQDAPVSNTQTPDTQVPHTQAPNTQTPSDEISYANYTDLTQPPKTPRARLQKGQRVQALKAFKGLDIKRFARRLGQISSITRGKNGQLYITDPDSGRVFIVPDRNQDGRPEQIRPLPYHFNAPSAAVELRGYLYVADQQALWKMPLTRISAEKPVQLASLQNTQSTGPYFLAAVNTAVNTKAQSDTPHLTLGYTTQTGKLRLISIDPQTGRAELQDETDGTLQQLAMPSDPSSTKPWAAYQSQEGLRLGAGLNNPAAFGLTATAAGLALPHKDNLPDNWPKTLRDHIFISQANPVNVIAVPTSLGTVLPRGLEVFSGFQNGRTAWGRAGVLHIDKRGLFVADPFNGDLWLIRPKIAGATAEKQDRVKAALNRFKAAIEQDEKPLKRNPLDGIYDSQFPVSSTPSDTSNSNPKSSNTPDAETPNQTSPKP